nr:hypothetical protein [Tanacetum cinerariifolium]
MGVVWRWWSGGKRGGNGVKGLAGKLEGAQWYFKRGRDDTMWILGTLH